MRSVKNDERKVSLVLFFVLLCVGGLLTPTFGLRRLTDAPAHREDPNSRTTQSAEPYKDPSLPIEKRVDDLVSRMTLEEKVSQMMNGAAAIDRLGVPAYEW